MSIKTIASIVLLFGGSLACQTIDDENASAPVGENAHWQALSEDLILSPSTEEAGELKKSKGHDNPKEQKDKVLARQLNAAVGFHSDRNGQVRFPMLDRPHWRRVKFKTIDHFTGFKYSKKSAYSAAFLLPTENRHPDSRQCMAAFEKKIFRVAHRFGVKNSPVLEAKPEWEGKELLVHATDGAIRVFFSKYEFSTAWAAYPAYENGCLVFAFATLWGEKPEIARDLRNRWVQDVAPLIQAETAALPPLE